MRTPGTRSITLEHDSDTLFGEVSLGTQPRGLVVLATGASTGRYATLETGLQRKLQEHGIATMKVAVVTDAEADDRSARTDVGTLMRRLDQWLDLIDSHGDVGRLDRLLCGVDVVAAALADCAATQQLECRAVAFLNGRLDLSETACCNIGVPLLFFVDESHSYRTEVNRTVYQRVDTDDASFLQAPVDDGTDIVARWMETRIAPRDTVK